TVRILNTEVYENLDGVMEMIGREVLIMREHGKTLRLIVPGPPPLARADATGRYPRPGHRIHTYRPGKEPVRE
ncbi:MAG: hypothetical protein ACHRXM_29820, partial [Isosphaerales bacterium]